MLGQKPWLPPFWLEQLDPEAPLRRMMLGQLQLEPWPQPLPQL